MRRWMVIVICVIVVVIVGIGLYTLLSNIQSSSLKLTASSPSNQQKDVSPSDPIVLHYSQPIKSVPNNQVFSSPNAVFEISVNGSDISLRPLRPLSEKTQYLLTLNNVTSSKNQTITTTITFTTGLDQSKRARFIRTLPHITNNYAIYYDQDNDTFNTQLLTKPLEQAKAQALQYFRDQGVEPNQQKIQFDVIRSLEGSGAPPG